MTKLQYLQPGLCMAVAGLVLAGCGKAPATTAANTAASPAAAVAPAAAPAAGSPADSAFLAAGEPFEALTEQARGASPAVLDGLIAKAEGAASAVRASLPAAAAQQIDAKLGEIKTARQANQRSDLALASIEVYRILVSNVSPAVKTPIQVNLLDYAGFRYDADLKATPSRWSDMNQAVAVAQDNWRILSPQIADAALRAKVDRALGDMDSAAKGRKGALAASAAKSELDLVDALEASFTKH